MHVHINQCHVLRIIERRGNNMSEHTRQDIDHGCETLRWEQRILDDRSKRDIDADWLLCGEGQNLLETKKALMHLLI